MTFFALIACAGWLGYRLWASDPEVHFGAFEVILLCLAGLFFLGATYASAKRPALFTAWEWLGMVLLLVLIRQVIRTPQERQGILAVMLAGVVALGVEGVVQSTITLPMEKAAAKNKQMQDHLVEKYRVQGFAPSPGEIREIADRIENRRAHGSYFHPTSMAAVCVLFLPVLFGCVVACVRSGAGTGQLVLTVASFAVVFVALCFTGVWLGVLALLLALSGLVAVYWPVHSGGWKGGLVLAVGWALTLIYVFRFAGVLYPAETSFRDVWPTSWRLIEEHFWLGVGPAQFIYYYPRYMTESNGIKAAQSGNAFLDLMASVGVFGGLALVMLVVSLTRSLLRYRLVVATATQSQGQGVTQAAPVSPPTAGLTLWEFYLGGMIGLILAFVYKAGVSPGEEIIQEAITAGIRAIVWFAAYGLFETIAWSTGEFLNSLMTGIFAMFLLLMVQPGFEYPSVAALLFACVALVLCVIRPEPNAFLGKMGGFSLLLAPLLLGTAFGFFALVFYPASVSNNTMKRAKFAGMMYQVEYLVKEKPETRTINDPYSYIHERILLPLATAFKDDKENIRLMTMAAVWNAEAWVWRASGQNTPADQAVTWAGAIQRQHPEGPDGYFAERDVRLQLVATLRSTRKSLEEEGKAKKDKKDKVDPKDGPPRMPEAQRKATISRLDAMASEQYIRAAEAVMRYVQKDPTDPRLRYQVAGFLNEAGKTPEALEAAKEALRMDSAVPPRRKLSDRERDQLQKIVKPETKK